MKIPTASRLEQWCAKNAMTGRVLGLFLLVLSAGLTLARFGPGAGFLVFIISLMTLGSLIILVRPLRILNGISLLGIFALVFLAEIGLG
ncbi:MAG: hypothetical protein AAGA86_13485 [Bacteroidota bacterium]